MVQRKVIVRGATNQALDELDASDIPDLSASYDAAGTAGTHVADTSAAHAASSIGFTPNGSIASTDVQAAIQEVRDEASGSGIPATIVDVKGDLIVATAADTVDRLAAGADDTILMADAAAGTGLKWVAPATPSTQAFGDAAAAGTGDTFTRGDHKHAMPADPVTAHAAASDPHTGYRLESASILPADLDVTADNTTADATTGHHGLLLKLGGGSTNFLRADGTWAAPSGSGAPASVDYLVGTADGGLSGEIVVGTTPGGELGGTWASPTVDATHSGSAHIQDHTHAATGQGATGGGATLTPVTLNLPTGTPATTEGQADWDATLRGLSVYDSVRARLVTPIGWAPYLSHPSFNNNTPIAGTAVTLAAVSAGNGGAVAYAVFCGSPMLLQDYVIWQTSTSLARSAEVRLYSDRLNNSGTIDFVAGTNATFSFTPGAASRQVSGAVSGAPVVLAPGWYWIVIRNTSASQTFVLGVVANATQLWFQHSGETNAIAALGSTLDMLTGWSAANGLGAIMGRGRLFGQSAAW